MPNSQLFSVIAESVTVAEGGIVSYKNNTMSEYLITTASIKNAVMTDAYRLNSQSVDKKPISWYFMPEEVCYWCF
jgi:endo-beta-N-acetylglucosaminidase D